MLNITYQLVSLRFFGEGFFGFPTWYEHLDGPEISSIYDFWLIAAAVLEMVVRLSALLAVAYFIYGGFVLMTSQGAPDRISSGRMVLVKAAVGLVIALLSANLVAFVAGIFSTSEDTGSNIPGVAADGSTIENVLRYIFTILGALSVLMVVIGGIRYIVAAGNPQQAAVAKNTIIYALIGIVVSVSAFLITAFIFSVVRGEDPSAYMNSSHVAVGRHL